MAGHKFAFTEADIADREAAAEKAVHDAVIAGVAGQDETNTVVRDLLPEKDFDSGSDNGWTDNDKWEQTGLTDGENKIYKIDPSSNAENKAIAIYGVMTLKSTPLTTRIKFMKGAEDSNMGVKDYVDVEPSYNQDNLILLLKDVILYKPKEDGHIIAVIDGAGDEELVFLGKVAEKAGETISGA